jgi:myo-inositol 2-dehydrogenase / D-chiro-inositol 1-dehydrogenase
MTIRIGLLGAGRIGKVHAAAIASTPGAQLVAVADASSDAAEVVAGPAGAKVLTIDKIIGSKAIDAVLIATPTDMHADLIEQVARAGKAVFCEKPIDLSVLRVRECLQVVSETNALLMVGFNRRFDSNFREVKNRIEAGDVGKVEMINITSRDPGPPPIEYIKRSGGLFRDMTVHDLDMARYLLDEEPIEVTAVGSVLVDKAIGKAGDVDSAAVTLRTKSGRIVHISNSRRATYGYDQRIEVHGSKGLVSAENVRATSVEVANGEGYRRERLHDFFMTRYRQAFASQIGSFVAAVAGHQAVTPTGADGLAALILAEAAVRSHAEGRTVKISEV